jgi:lysozyme
MIYSNNGLHLTEQFEGLRLEAYQDVVGIYTIGWGHTRDVKKGDTCSRQQAEQYLYDDIQACVTAINRDCKVELTQGQFDALVDFSFNLGISALEHSTLWTYLNAGDFEGASNEFPKWHHAGGKDVPGLLRRRIAEQDEFNK